MPALRNNVGRQRRQAAVAANRQQRRIGPAHRGRLQGVRRMLFCFFLIALALLFKYLVDHLLANNFRMCDPSSCNSCKIPALSCGVKPDRFAGRRAILCSRISRVVLLTIYRQFVYHLQVQVNNLRSENLPRIAALLLGLFLHLLAWFKAESCLFPRDNISSNTHHNVQTTVTSAVVSTIHLRQEILKSECFKSRLAECYLLSAISTGL